ncbi:MAG: ParB/RepB/Spo0J family partition protein [Chthoniobacterales bacterium]|nr:ParB/RepB/Spo0J family partition protein [Chthoniobacterales bacterium]
MAKPSLGRGLGALIAPSKAAAAAVAAAEAAGERVQTVALALVVPSPLQPRSNFSPELLTELVNSIRENGIIQPLIVRQINGLLELIAGERRWRAAGQAGLKEVPVIVREASDLEVLELALVENLQRSDLNPIEEATAYARLAREFKLKQEDIAKKVGKSRAAVANTMRLLDLDAEVQGHLLQGRLSVGHAKALLGLRGSEEQRAIAAQVMKKSLSVRATEDLVGAHLTKGGTVRKGRNRNARAVSPAVQHVENRLQQHLSTRVEIHHADDKGRIIIEYYGNDDLQRLLAQLGLPQE